MSSAPGLGLSPVFEGNAPQAYTCHYTADYGHFLSWQAPDYKVTDLGSDATVREQRVYWTFGEAAGNATRPEVHISMDIIDTPTGKVIGHATKTIDWADGDTAIPR